MIRFPDGDYEYDFTRRLAPAVGETIVRRGTTWRVTRRTEADVPTLHVQRAGRGTLEGEATVTPYSH